MGVDTLHLRFATVAGCQTIDWGISWISGTILSHHSHAGGSDGTWATVSRTTGEVLINVEVCVSVELFQWDWGRDVVWEIVYAGAKEEVGMVWGHDSQEVTCHMSMYALQRGACKFWGHAEMGMSMNVVTNEIVLFSLIVCNERKPQRKPRGMLRMIVITIKRELYSSCCFHHGDWRRYQAYVLCLLPSSDINDTWERCFLLFQHTMTIGQLHSCDLGWQRLLM